MLSEIDQDRLGRALVSIEKHAPHLDELIAPGTPASGTNAGRGVSQPRSRPPLSMNPLVLKMQLQDGLRRWAIRVCFAHGLLSPKGSQPSVWANWLYARLPELCALESSNIAVEEFEQLARELMDVVSPPEPVRQPGERVVPQAGTASELAQATAVLGCGVSKSAIRRWAKAGLIASRTRPDGAAEYPLDEVVARARGVDERLAEARRVE